MTTKEKAKICRERWRKSDAGKEYMRRYRNSPAFAAAKERYLAKQIERRAADPTYNRYAKAFAERKEELEPLGRWEDRVYWFDTKESQQWLRDVRMREGCRDCGIKELDVLCFYGATKLSSRAGYTVMKAIAGCPILCFNCARRGMIPINPIKLRILKIKESRGCLHCGMNDGRCLDFHHRDQSTKKSDISHLGHRISMKSAMEEMGKCDILCANCHRKEHSRLRAEAKP